MPVPAPATSFRKSCRRVALIVSALALPALSYGAEQRLESTPVNATDASAFVVITNFFQFQRSAGTNANETVFTSSDLPTSISWDELIPSWNIQQSTNAGFKFEVRPVWPDDRPQFFNLGLWTVRPGPHRRESVNGQKNSVGSVETDTLLLTKVCQAVQLRITVTDKEPVANLPIDFLGLSLFNRRAFVALSTNLPSEPAHVLDVPERSQIAYEGGRDWCSPTSVSMVLAYWARLLRQPSLDRDVPTVAAGVHDPTWPGTGNWPFNTAFAGKFPGLRAYVTRLSGLAELQSLLEAGVPPIISVSFDLLNGKEKDSGAGHLVVCVGTKPNGDFVVNDPWAHLDKGERVQRTVPGHLLARGWSRSRGVVYLIHPVTWPLSPNRHWPSQP